MIRLGKSFLSDEKGATAIEYAMIALFIGVAIVGSATNIGTALTGVFTDVTTGFGGAGGGGGG